MERTIRFKLPAQISLLTMRSSATTWGQLKEEILRDPVLKEEIPLDTVPITREGRDYIRSFKFIDKDTFAEYGKIDDAVLPDKDLIFIITPVEHKGGATNSNKIADLVFLLTWDPVKLIINLEEANYNTLRSFGSHLNRKYDKNIDLSGTKEEMKSNIIKAVNEYVNSRYDKLRISAELTGTELNSQEETFPETYDVEMEQPISAVDLLERSIIDITKAIKLIKEDEENIEKLKMVEQEEKLEKLSKSLYEILNS